MIVLNDVCYGNKQFRLQVPRLHVYPGLTLLVGQNGAGKSTLLKLLATAAIPHAGDIRYEGHSVTDSLPQIRSRVGFLPSELELYEDMTPRKLLRYLSDLKGVSGANDGESVLVRFHLADMQDRKIGALSQGQQQRLAIAQSLLGSPAYVFMDEPLNSLDAAERRHAAFELRSYANDATVLIATHELGEWHGIDEIVWLDEGRLAFQGPPEAWVQGLDMGVWRGTVSKAEAGVLRARLGDRIIHSRWAGTAFELRIVAEQAPAVRFTPDEMTLEDAYFIRRWMSRVKSS